MRCREAGPFGRSRGHRLPSSIRDRRVRSPVAFATISLTYCSLSPQARPKLLTFDHIFPPPSAILERPPRTAILYASLTSSNFHELHLYLMKLTNRLDPHVEYVFRHIPPAVPSEARNFLSGYGVALDLKKMDYLALDDRNSNAEGEPSAVP